MTDKLDARLRIANRAELDDLLHDLKLDPAKYRDHSDQQLAKVIGAELRSVAGHSLVNVLRRRPFPYKQILIDVADKLEPGLRWTSFKASGPESIEDIEDYIAVQVDKRLAALVDVAKRTDTGQKELQKLLESELRRRGMSQQVVQSALVALAAGTVSGAALGPTVSIALFSSVLSSFFGLSLIQIVLGRVLVGGPVGILLSLLALLASPSYSKTIPAVCRIILIRKSADQKKSLQTKT
jgi:uncharacterized protein YaaW (UPF0174 family)